MTKSINKHVIQKGREQSKLKQAEVLLNEEGISAIQTRTFFYQGVPSEYETDKRTQVIRDRKFHKEQIK